MFSGAEHLNYKKVASHRYSEKEELVPVSANRFMICLHREDDDDNPEDGLPQRIDGWICIPVCIDEVQHIAGNLQAIKREKFKDKNGNVTDLLLTLSTSDPFLYSKLANSSVMTVILQAFFLLQQSRIKCQTPLLVALIYMPSTEGGNLIALRFVSRSNRIML